MRRLPDGFCDLIYADPPFDTKLHFEAGPLHARNGHSRGIDPYLDFLGPRLIEMHRLLSRRGSLYVHVDGRCAHAVKLLLDAIFGARQFLNEIIWHYRSGSRPGRWFARKHDTIFLYARRAGEHTFHRLRAGRYRTLDLRMDADGRLFKSTRKGRLYFDPAGPVMDDVWELPILSTVSGERTGYPSQKPEALLERILAASSEEGDLVGDFFCGSGTTAAVARRMKRRWFACDRSRRAAAIARRRLAE
jgi:DNA modification methylase